MENPAIAWYKDTIGVITFFFPAIASLYFGIDLNKPDSLNYTSFY